MRLLIAATLALLTAPAFAASAIPFHDMIAGSFDDFARPKFAALAKDAADLKDNVAALCATPSETTLQSAQAAFKATVLSYSAVEFVRFGPLGVDNRVERLLFWPDNKGIALRQVQAAIGTEDPTAANPEALRNKSVAMQGLGAAEYLLFGTGFDDLASSAGAYRCQFAAAATALIGGLTATLSAEWADPAPGGAADAMLNPTSTSVDYRSELEVINKLAGALTFGTDTIRDQRLSPVLSLSTGTPKPKSALFWRSGMSAKAMAANFTGLRDFFRAAKFGPAMGAANAWIAKGAEFEFESAIGAAGEVPGPMEAAITDPEGLRGLKQMYVSTGSLDTLLGDSLGGALGLTTGFSALDGD